MPCVELAARTGTGLLPAQWRLVLVAAEREEGLLPYLAKIENASAVVRTLYDWRRVTVEAITDAFSDGLAAVELRFSPQFIAGMTGLDADEVIDAISDATGGVAAGLSGSPGSGGRRSFPHIATWLAGAGHPDADPETLAALLAREARLLPATSRHQTA